MAAHIGQPTRSRRFIKAYLMTWGLLAVGALGYLAMLAFPPQADGDPAGSGAPKVLAEVRSLEGNLSEVRKDVTELQEAMGERVANEKVVNSRLTALEERVTSIDPPQPPATEPEGKLPDKTAQKVLEPHTTADILAKTRDVKAEPAKAEEVTAPPSAPKASTPPATPIETGSINSKSIAPRSIAPKRVAAKEEIIFGEAVVKPATRNDFAVQLAAGPSLQVLRQSWGLLVERHRASLAALEPRVVAPRGEGGVYRLLAGPVPTKADADRICAEMGAGPKLCFATPYAGAPL